MLCVCGSPPPPPLSLSALFLVFFFFVLSFVVFVENVRRHPPTPAPRPRLGLFSATSSRLARFQLSLTSHPPSAFLPFFRWSSSWSSCFTLAADLQQETCVLPAHCVDHIGRQWLRRGCSLLCFAFFLSPVSPLRGPFLMVRALPTHGRAGAERGSGGRVWTVGWS